MQGGIKKKIGLFLLIFGIPLSFLYILANGKSNINSLKFYGKEITEEGKYKIKDFTFYDIDSNVVNKESLKGKTIITSILTPSCPSSCYILSKQLDEFVYKKIIHDSRLTNFVFLSQFVDTSANQKENFKLFLSEQNIDVERWFMVTGNSNPIYDIELPKGNLLNRNTPRDNALKVKTYQRMFLLIDKNHFVRGIYQGNKTQEIERLRKEIRVLEREYKKEKTPQNKSK